MAHLVIADAGAERPAECLILATKVATFTEALWLNPAVRPTCKLTLIGGKNSHNFRREGIQFVLPLQVLSGSLCRIRFPNDPADYEWTQRARASVTRITQQRVDLSLALA